MFACTAASAVAGGMWARSSHAAAAAACSAVSAAAGLPALAAARTAGAAVGKGHAPAAGSCSSAYHTTTAMQQQGQQGPETMLPPGQTFLDSLTDYEKVGVPAAAGVAAPDAQSSSSSSSSRGFDLGTMRQLLAAMGSPQQQLSVVHIAGTKGKGSVAALISGVLRAAGYRVGTYTSPHMFNIRERIVVGGVGAPHLRPPSAPGPTPPAAAAACQDSSSQHTAAVPVSQQQFEALAVQAADAVAAMQSGGDTGGGQQQQQQQHIVKAGDTPTSTSSSSPPPSHFEVVTAMALQHFVNEGADIAVIETGLGGATDATNVFGPQQLQLAVLTAVGLDHVQALGGSLASIARAKAGIMKAGVPVVVGPQEGAPGTGGSSGSSGSSSDVVLGVLREVAGAPDMQCPLLMAEQVVQVAPPSAAADSSSSSSSGVLVAPGPGEHVARQLLSVTADAARSTLPGSVTVTEEAAAADSAPSSSLSSLSLPSVQLQLVGQHQAGNVQTAVAAALLLAARGWCGITEQAVLQGLQSAWLPGRFQVAQLPGSPTHYVLDGAHTADSAAALARTLRQAFPSEPVVLVVAMAADKQHRDVLQVLRDGIRPKVVVFTSVPIAGSHARVAPPGTLAAHWQAAAMLSTGRHFRCREMIQAGLGAAVDKARHELGAYAGRGVVVVTGSLHAVAAGLKQLQLAS